MTIQRTDCGGHQVFAYGEPLPCPKCEDGASGGDVERKHRDLLGAFQGLFEVLFHNDRYFALSAALLSDAPILAVPGRMGDQSLQCHEFQ